MFYYFDGNFIIWLSFFEIFEWRVWEDWLIELMDKGFLINICLLIMFGVEVDFNCLLIVYDVVIYEVILDFDMEGVIC